MAGAVETYRSHHLWNSADLHTLLINDVLQCVPKVPYISKVSLFSAVCGWIPKPFDLLIALTVRFDLVYEVA